MRDTVLAVPGEHAIGEAAARHQARLLLVYGSVAIGRVTPMSDLDLGVWYGDAQRAMVDGGALLRDIVDVLPGNAPELDLAVLDVADPLLQFMAATDGRVIFEADRSAYVEFRVRASALYHDTAEQRRRLREHLRAYAHAVRAGTERR